MHCESTDVVRRQSDRCETERRHVGTEDGFGETESQFLSVGFVSSSKVTYSLHVYRRLCTGMHANVRELDKDGEFCHCQDVLTPFKTERMTQDHTFSSFPY